MYRVTALSGTRCYWWVPGEKPPDAGQGSGRDGVRPAGLSSHPMKKADGSRVGLDDDEGSAADPELRPACVRGTY